MSKKITVAQRIVDIFTNEPLEACDVLRDVADNILKQRRGTPAKKARKPKPAADAEQGGQS